LKIARCKLQIEEAGLAGSGGYGGGDFHQAAIGGRSSLLSIFNFQFASCNLGFSGHAA
jgi:hypothetical protein